MILADTHAVIWLSDEQNRLSSEARNALIAARLSGGIAISAMSLWEIALLVSKGRITISQPLPIYLRDVESTYVVLPVEARVALRSTEFGPAYPQDPVDRIIGATALVHDLQLVTKDKGIWGSGEVPCVW